MPLLIQKTNTIPPNFSLSTEQTKAVLGGYRLKEAYQQDVREIICKKP